MQRFHFTEEDRALRHQLHSLNMRFPRHRCKPEISRALIKLLQPDYDIISPETWRRFLGEEPDDAAQHFGLATDLAKNAEIGKRARANQQARARRRRYRIDEDGTVIADIIYRFVHRPSSLEKTAEELWYDFYRFLEDEDLEPSGRHTDEGDLLALHPTVKPVKLIMEALLDCSKRGGIVLDPFIGSGTTLIAAERSGRTCHGIELDPLYADVAIRRWEKHTGDRAVHAVTGAAFEAS